MRIFPLALFIGALAVGLWIAFRRVFSDPAYQATREIPYVERWRLSKLARSEQPIADPEQSRKAEALARLTLSSHERTFSPRHLAILVFLLFVPRLLVDRDTKDIMFSVALAALMLIGFLWSRRMRSAIQRTAEINGWDLDGSGNDGRGTG